MTELLLLFVFLIGVCVAAGAAVMGLLYLPHLIARTIAESRRNK